MKVVDATKFQTSALAEFDDFMLDATVKTERVSPLATLIWSDVLQELGNRDEVTLVSGSYDDVGNALVKRHYVLR